MKVRIHDISNIEKPVIYIAENENDCRNKTEKSAYESCILIGDVVTMGKIIAEPVN